MPSLWTPASWPDRLAELEATTPELKSAPLRRDVRSLGTLLGEVLREQSGTALFDAVEALRRSSITRREGELPLLPDRQLTWIRPSPPSVPSPPTSPTAYHLARAFSFYFELINLAETNHRKRRRLATQLSPDAIPQRGSLRGTLRRLRLAGHPRSEALALLGRICITPVFTAHPTEVARRSVMFKRRRISDLLEQLDRIPVAATELDSLERDLLAEITALWQTDDVRTARPTVRDEIRMALDYYEASLFNTLPVLYAEVAAALDAEYPTPEPSGGTPPLMSSRSEAEGSASLPKLRPASTAQTQSPSPPSPSSSPSAPGSAATATATPSSMPPPPAKPSPLPARSSSPTTAAASRPSTTSSAPPPSRSPSAPLSRRSSTVTPPS